MAVKLARPVLRIGAAVATAGASEAAGPILDAAIEAGGKEAERAADEFWRREDGRRAAMQQFRAALTEITKDGTPLIIVVDELDRCRPDYALSLLETIKHFFAVERVHFVLGVNSQALENIVRVRYGAGIDATDYLKRFISVSMHLPKFVGSGTNIRAQMKYLEAAAADMGICAGDIANNIERSIDFLFAEISPHMPVVATLGNHDYYGSSIDRALEYAQKWTAGTNVHILENGQFRRDDLRVIGATLWTDFEIASHDAGHVPVDVRRDFAASVCRQYLLDFREIYRSDERADGEGGFITAAEMIARHKESRAYIDATLAETFDGTTIVLTHHAPTARSLDPRFDGHVTNAAFASDLSAMIQKRKPTFWVHGHIHCFQDYGEGETRVLCNPRGYARESGSSGFRPGFVVETTVEEEDDPPLACRVE